MTMPFCNSPRFAHSAEADTDGRQYLCATDGKLLGWRHEYAALFEIRDKICGAPRRRQGEPEVVAGQDGRMSKRFTCDLHAEHAPPGDGMRQTDRLPPSSINCVAISAISAGELQCSALGFSRMRFISAAGVRTRTQRHRDTLPESAHMHAPLWREFSQRGGAVPQQMAEGPQYLLAD